jgi:hypothetical protein
LIAAMVGSFGLRPAPDKPFSRSRCRGAQTGDGDDHSRYRGTADAQGYVPVPDGTVCALMRRPDLPKAGLVEVAGADARVGRRGCGTWIPACYRDDAVDQGHFEPVSADDLACAGLPETAYPARARTMASS